MRGKYFRLELAFLICISGGFVRAYKGHWCISHNPIETSARCANLLSVLQIQVNMNKTCKVFLLIRCLQVNNHWLSCQDCQ